MRRRTTLGTVSQEALNNRQNAGAPGRVSSVNGPVKRASMAVGKRPSQPVGATGRLSVSQGRSSFAAGGRKSSASVGVRKGGGYGSGQPDPRPVSDRNFINASIRALIEYLMDHNYEQPISAKLLTRPSGRDVANIMSFLFRQYDHTWQLKPGQRFEDEVIPFLKSIRYPFTLSKASLQAVGAPQTWPKVLAAISWLIELLSYDEEVQAHEQEQQEKRARGEADGVGDQNSEDKAFLDYLGKAYSCFLDGDDETYTQLEEELVGSLEAQNKQVAQAVEEAEARAQQLHKQIDEVKARASLLPQLQARQKDCHSDLNKFTQFSQQLQEHKEALVQKVDSRSQDEDKLKGELSSLRGQISELRERVQNQELSAEDVQRMARERQRLKEGMAAAAEHKAQASKRLWESEMELSKRLDTLEQSVHLYGIKAQALLLVPKTASNANGRDYELVVHRDCVHDEDRLLSQDVKGSIRPALAALKDGVARLMQTNRQELLELLDAEEASEEALGEVRDQASLLEAKVRRVEESFRKEKEALELAVQDKTQRVAAMEAKLASLRDPSELERDISRAQATAKDLATDLQAGRDDWAREYEALHSAIMEALTLCTDHKEDVHNRIAEMRAAHEAAWAGLLGRPLEDWLSAPQGQGLEAAMQSLSVTGLPGHDSTTRNQCCVEQGANPPVVQSASHPSCPEGSDIDELTAGFEKSVAVHGPMPEEILRVAVTLSQCALDL